LYALGVPLKEVTQRLKTFEENTGRFNLFEIDDVRIMLDYGHNPAGYEQVIKACHNLFGVIGMPGDRLDTAIQAVGKRCERFLIVFISKKI